MLTRAAIINARDLAIRVAEQADDLWMRKLITTLRTTRCIRKAVRTVASTCRSLITLGAEAQAACSDELITEIELALARDTRLPRPSESSPRTTFHGMAMYHLEMGLLVSDEFLTEVAAGHIGVPWDTPRFDNQMPDDAWANYRHEMYWHCWLEYANGLRGTFDPFADPNDPINVRTRAEMLYSVYKTAEYNVAEIVRRVRLESAAVIAQLALTEPANPTTKAVEVTAGASITWKAAEELAAAEVAIVGADYRFENCLIAAANCWAEILRHDVRDVSLFVVNLASFFEWYRKAAKLWNESAIHCWPESGKVKIGHYTEKNAAIAAMNLFSDLSGLLFDGPMADAKLWGARLIDGHILADFRKSLKQHLIESGIPNKPADGIAVAREVEILILDEAKRPEVLERQLDSLYETATQALALSSRIYQTEFDGRLPDPGCLATEWRSWLKAAAARWDEYAGELGRLLPRLSAARTIPGMAKLWTIALANNPHKPSWVPPVWSKESSEKRVREGAPPELDSDLIDVPRHYSSFIEALIERLETWEAILHYLKESDQAYESICGEGGLLGHAFHEWQTLGSSAAGDDEFSVGLQCEYGQVVQAVRQGAGYDKQQFATDERIDPSPQVAAENISLSRSKRKKRATKKESDGTELCRAHLLAHHNYRGKLNTSPTSPTEMEKAGVTSKATATRFFRARWGGHKDYVRICGDVARLEVELGLLAGDVALPGLKRLFQDVAAREPSWDEQGDS